MNDVLHPRSILTASICLMIACGSARGGGAVTQEFELNPGWNAVFLEVQPEPRDPATVFAGIASRLESVWTWMDRYSTVEFIEDPNEGLWGQPAWHVYFPASGADPARAALSNLFAVVGCRAYLIHLGGTGPVTLSVTGSPSVRSIRWTPNSFNLVGFHVKGDSPPTFASYFAPSAAHAGQPVYRLTQAGAWEPVTNLAAETVRAGEAYWVWCEGGSTYQGSLGVELPMTDGLVYGASLPELPLTLRNLSAASRSITLTMLSPDVSLAHRRLAETASGYTWAPLTDAEPVTIDLASGKKTRLALAVARKDLLADTAASTLEILDDQGIRILVPVQASRVLPVAKKKDGRKQKAVAYAGLWIGNVEVTGVSQAQEGSLEPTPTGTPFSFRMIIHVDAAGQARLLKEVVQMWQNGTTNPDGTLNTPGRYVLVTDESLLGNFEGASMRDGRPVGYRLSTVAYDFDPDPDPFEEQPGYDAAAKAVTLTGSFAQGASLTCTLNLGFDHATNPFKHRYHPDHDNWDARYVTDKEEAYPVSRAMTFSFTTRDPDNPDPDDPDSPDWGVNIAGGNFQETISGLHKHDIRVEGTFRLQRVCVIEELNQ